MLNRRGIYFPVAGGLLLGVLILVVGGVSAATLTVCSSGCDYTSIQAAVNAAASGDTISVGAGTYTENVDVNKSVSLVGAGADVTIVQAASSNDHVFEVTANYVNISGFTVKGATVEGKAGVYLHEVSHSIISNSSIVTNEGGIHLYRGWNNLLSNNDINSNVYGIRLGTSPYWSSDNVVANNTLTSNEYGIAVYYSTGTLLSNNISSNRYGVYLGAYASNNNITENTFQANTEYGIYLGGSNENNNIWKNRFYDSGIRYIGTHLNMNFCVDVGNYYAGSVPAVQLPSVPSWYPGHDCGPTPNNDVYVDQTKPTSFEWDVSATYANIQEAIYNTNVNRTTWIIEGTGPYLEEVQTVRRYTTLDCQGEALKGNNTGSGIYINEITGTTIKNCIISNFSNGIHLYRGWNNLLSNNDINSNVYGIRLGTSPYWSSDNVVANNTLTSNEYGIAVYYSTGTLLSNNISSNRYGVYLEAHASNNNITKNTFRGNEYGLYRHCTYYTCSYENKIYHNNFIDNYYHAYLEYQTWYSEQFDNGYPSGGNYWSDYTGVDLYSGPYQNESGSDGIGDSVQGIYSGYCGCVGDKDWYPLMELWENYDIEPAIAESPWPMFQHDPQHTGRSPFVGAQSATLRWSYGTGTWIKSSPTITSDGTIYIGSYGDWGNVTKDPALYAINPDGSLKWKYATGSGDISPGIGPDGTVYTFGSEGLLAINPNGTLRWSYPRGGMSIVGPTVGPDGTIYITAGRYISTINPNGTLKWNYDAYPSIFSESSPTIGLDGTIYVGGIYGKLYALNANGTLKWTYNNGTYRLSAAAVASDGTIYYKSSDKYLYAINPDGTLKWRVYSGGWSSHPIPSPAIGVDGTIYVGGGPYDPITTDDEYVYAINPNGTLKWKYKTVGTVWSSPAIGADGTVYIGSYDGYLYAINPEGALKWRGYIGGSTLSSPAIGSDGTVYIGSYGKRLYAFGPRPTPENPPNSPTSLYQFESDGATEIPEGGTTTESTVVFKGTVSDPDGDNVRLEIELRQIDEPFTGEPTPETISGLVTSGSEVSITRFGLVNEDYHWQFRAKDSNGATSEWVEFGTPGNVDFTVAVPKTIAQLITENAIGGVPVTVNGQLYFILTLSNRIDPATLEVLPDSGLTKVYVDTDNFPVSDPEIARKIGIVDFARRWQQGLGSPVNLAQKSEYLINEWLAYKGIEFEDETLELINIWFSLNPLSSFIHDSLISWYKQSVWDPLNELRDTANTDIQNALDNYQSAQKVAGNEIEDHDVAYTYLKDFWEGEVYQNSATSLLRNVNKIGMSKLDRTKDYFLWEKFPEFLDKIFGGFIEGMSEFLEMNLEAVDAIKWYNKYTQEKSFGMKNVEFILSQQLHEATSYTLQLAQTSRISIGVQSPVMLRVYDQQRRVTGLMDEVIKEEIPYSIYDNKSESIVIFLPNASYFYEVVGTENGTYGLTITLIENGNITNFTATYISTSTNVTHKYTVNWALLKQGEEGVTVQIDSDGDGIFEQTITSDSELTQEEFILQTETNVSIDPDTLNLQSKGKWIEANIAFPTGYNITDINITTIRLNDTVPVNTGHAEVEDEDDNETPTLEVKFNRQNVITLINESSNNGTATLTITGNLYDGTAFKGSDTIRIVDGKKKDEDNEKECKHETDGEKKNEGKKPNCQDENHEDKEDYEH